MTREIKFRAWDTEEKRMFIPIFYVDDAGFIDKRVFMQYTGIHDKNDKEIFEGDIVQWENGRKCEVYWFSSPAHNGWDLIAWNMKGKPNEDYCLWEGLEIIGNIYENPELLGASKPC